MSDSSIYNQIANTHETAKKDVAVKTTAAKAYVGAGIAAVVAGLSVAVKTLDDGVINAQEGINIAIAVLISLGTVFGGVYATTNRRK